MTTLYLPFKSGRQNRGVVVGDGLDVKTQLAVSTVAEGEQLTQTL